MGYQKINNLGVYGSLSELWSAHPEGGREGDFALVGGTEYYWNKYERNWSGSPSDQPSAGYPTTTVDGDFHVSNDLFVGGNIHVRGDVYAEGENIPVTPGEGGEGGEGGSYDDTELKTRMSAAERGIENLRANKQDKLTPGDGIKITVTTISVDPDYFPSEGGGGQVQADWAQGDSTKPDFIKNKPTFKTINGEPIFGPNGGNIVTPTSGGGGGGIRVVDESDPNADTSDPTQTYFFSHSRLQGVGLYNILLQNGSLTGTDGVIYTYHPGKFYRLYDDGSFDEVAADADHYASFKDNIVYYNFKDDKGELHSVRTTLERYGHLVFPHKYQYADTSDTAYYAVQVRGPFFAEATDVTLSYDPNALSVHVIENGAERQVNSGGILRFTYQDYYQARFLVVRRRYSDIDELKRAKDIEVTFNNGYEDTVVTFKYGAAKVFYKDGDTRPMSGVNGFTPVAGTKPTVEPGTSSFTFSGSGKLKVAENVVIDQTKYNMFYVKVANNPGFDFLTLFARREGWTSDYFTVYGPTSDTYYQTGITGGKSDCTVEYPLWRSSVVNCKMQDIRSDDHLTDITLKELLLRTTVNGSRYEITEIGVLTHEPPFDHYDH